MSCRKSIFKQFLNLALPGCATANQKRPILVRAFQTSFSNGE